MCLCRGRFDALGQQAQPMSELREDQELLVHSSLRRAGEQISKTECWFFFQVPDLPESPLYEVSMGRRGELVYTFDELVEEEWTVSVGIGD